MKVLVTGAAGFIGSALSMRLLQRGDDVIGIDNHNEYYDPALKESRLARQIDHPNYTHVRIDLADRVGMAALFEEYKPQRVVNLAAQAGVRYSLENPLSYIDSNLVSFGHILEGCRHYGVEHLVYASSSSVYGANTQMPFSVHHNVDHPLSLYAATKKANEMMAHSYSHLFDLPTSGLRFFTVYGPWGRPDMALFLFAEAMRKGEAINVFNHGKMIRDFTYVDDIVESITRLIVKPPKRNSDWDGDEPRIDTSTAPYRIFNIGNGSPVKLMRYIEAVETALGLKGKYNMMDIQPGDVPATHADTRALENYIGFCPETSVEEGVDRFIEWYKAYYNI